MLALAVGVTWIAFFLVCAAPPRSPMLRAAKRFLTFAFAWLLVEAIRITMLGGPTGGGHY